MLNLPLLAEKVMMRAYWDLAARDPNVRADAINFLTATTPDWSESLDTWCQLANMDPTYVIARTVNYLNTGAFVANAPVGKDSQ